MRSPTRLSPPSLWLFGLSRSDPRGYAGLLRHDLRWHGTLWFCAAGWLHAVHHHRRCVCWCRLGFVLVVVCLVVRLWAVGYNFVVFVAVFRAGWAWWQWPWLCPLRSPRRQWAGTQFWARGWHSATLGRLAQLGSGWVAAVSVVLVSLDGMYVGVVCLTTYFAIVWCSLVLSVYRTQVWAGQQPARSCVEEAQVYSRRADFPHRGFPRVRKRPPPLLYHVLDRCGLKK